MAALAVIARVSASSTPESPPLLFTMAKKYEAQAWLRGGERFPRGAQVVVETRTQRHLLVSGFEATADPAVSFDGSRVVFAGKKKSGDSWQVYEVGVDGEGVRRVTSGKEDCVRPFYLPEGRIVYAKKIEGQFVIEAMSLGVGAATRLTYWPGSSLPTDVLHDGRVLFESAFPSGSGATSELYAVYTDGSGVESYRCDHGRPRSGGRQVSSGDIVFASGRGLGRFTSARAQEVAVAAPRGEYAGDVVEMPSGEWLAAWRSDANKPFQLTRWKPGSSRLQTIAEGNEGDFVQPVIVAARAVPKRHPSGLHDWGYANLLCLNAYTSKLKFAGESIESVRLRTLDGSGADKVLGTARVEKDGSFYLRTPADQPLKIELLDRTGKTLQAEQGWFWLRRGEQRICVGCHAGPETAPENAVPAVLLRSIVPADMTGSPAAASKGGQ